MAVRNPYNTYKENSVKTASPEELTLMLYNGALKFINKGKMGIESNSIQDANEGINRAQDIIHELNNSLNMDYEMSENMRSLYTYILEKLVEGNIQKKIEPLDEAKGMVTELRDTWKEAMKLAKGKR